MSYDPPPEDPTPLRDAPGTAGALLRDGEAQFRQGLDESRAFRRGARARKRRAVASWSTAVVVWATVLVWMGTNGPKPFVSPAVLLVSAETPNPAPATVPSAVVATVAVSATAAIAPRPPPPAPTQSAQPLNASVSEESCRAQLAANKPERAVECFRTRSRERGVKGEVASYEAARVTVERLNDPTRALPWLEEHRQRFPEGALRGEVDWLRVRSLERTGRFQEALSASEALLASPAGRALSAELHLLRGRIQADALGNCSEAVSELVALIGEPSARGDEAELRRAACLEKLGRHADAIAAYTQYLAREEPKRAVEARERLAALQR